MPTPLPIPTLVPVPVPTLIPVPTFLPVVLTMSVCSTAARDVLQHSPRDAPWFTLLGVRCRCGDQTVRRMHNPRPGRIRLLALPFHIQHVGPIRRTVRRTVRRTH